MADLPEALVKIRARYPAAKCNRAEWAKIHALTKTEEPGKIEQATQMAKACTFDSPQLTARHFAAKKKQQVRVEYLKKQRAFEGEVAAELRRFAERAASYLASQEEGGKIPIGRLTRVQGRIKELNAEAYREIALLFAAFLKESIRLGLKGAMVVASTGIQKAKALMQEGELLSFVAAEQGTELVFNITLEEKVPKDPFRQKIVFAVDSGIFKQLFKGTLFQTMKAGLFGKNKLSSGVWDLRDQNLLQLKRLVASGISQGHSAGRISQDIRGLLLQPRTLRGAELEASRPGPGVYRSAYKNAMRLTRTETNRAFVGADMAFAKSKGWDVMWQVATGHREEDECDDLHGQVMTPEEFSDKYPLHPHDLCYSVLVPPEVG